MQKIRRIVKKGDTILEVTFAIMIFALIATISMQIMDRDIAMIQGALESEMARNEIDAQAEALRYIQNSYLSERELADEKRVFQNLWMKLTRTANESGSWGSIGSAGTGLANFPTDISGYVSTECSSYYDVENKTNNDEGIHNIFEDRAFVINTRKIDPSNIESTIIQSRIGNSGEGAYNTKFFTETQLYPRVLFTKKDDSDKKVHDEDVLAEIFPEVYDSADQIMQTNNDVYDVVERVEGLWVISARADNKGNRDNSTEKGVPEFYDFHIRTCWSAPGHDRPSTIATTIRLYNPEYIEGQKEKKQ